MQKVTWRIPVVILIAGILLGIFTTGIRHSFGLFLKPMSDTYGWGREVFSFAMALQSLLWGILSPLMGMLADRYGAGRMIFAGGLCYAGGVYLISQSGSPMMLFFSLGAMIALGISAAGFSVPMGVVSRAASDKNRSLYLGFFMGGGSLGIFAFAPFAQALINHYGWQRTLLVLSMMALVIPLMSVALKGERVDAASVPEKADPIGALRHAFKEKRFWLLFSGFFVCGFHVFFIAVHLPAYLADQGIPASMGALSLGLIGLFNIIGSLTSGWFGGHWSKRWGLSFIYFSRAIVISLFVFLPISQVTVVLFASAMGLLWLSTVPLTSGLVGHIYGVRYMATLFGFIFLGHQIGGFLGAWAGGWLYDHTGSYDLVWYSGIALGVIAALLHIPIDERNAESMLMAESPAPAKA